LRRDPVLALRNRERWTEAVRETEALRADGDTIPPYVREAEADALLALRRPRDARHGYEEVLRTDPTLRGAQIGRFFALVEEEEFSAAFQQVDQIGGAGKGGRAGAETERAAAERPMVGSESPERRGAVVRRHARAPRGN